MRITYDLNWYLEHKLGHKQLEIKEMTFQERIEKLREFVFNFDYGIDKEYKEVFEKGFISHFLFHEIGFGTWTRFHFELQANLQVHARRYNNLYQAEIKDIKDAINNVNMENLSESDSKTNTSATGDSNTDSESKSYSGNRASDTPQGRTEIDDNFISALSDAQQRATSTSGNTETNTQENIGEHIGKSTSKGYSGLTLTQLNRMFAEQMVVANEIIFYNLEKLFNQSVI